MHQAVTPMPAATNNEYISVLFLFLFLFELVFIIRIMRTTSAITLHNRTITMDE
jgi:hypothetical protein